MFPVELPSRTTVSDWISVLVVILLFCAFTLIFHCSRCPLVARDRLYGCCRHLLCYRIGIVVDISAVDTMLCNRKRSRAPLGSFRTEANITHLLVAIT